MRGTLGWIAAELGLQLHQIGKDVGLAPQLVGDHRRLTCSPSGTVNLAINEVDPSASACLNASRVAHTTGSVAALRSPSVEPEDLNHPTQITAAAVRRQDSRCFVVAPVVEQRAFTGRRPASRKRAIPLPSAAVAGLTEMLPSAVESKKRCITGEWRSMYFNSKCRLALTRSQQRNNFVAFRGHGGDVVCPPLHHSFTIRHPLRGIVRAPHFVSFDVCKLAFNPIAVEEIALI